MERFWQHLDPQIVDFSIHLLGALVILVFGWFLLRLLRSPMRRLLERGRFDPSGSSFLVGSISSVLMVVVLIAVLQQLGVQTASMVTLLGAVGLAVALSLQGSLANFAAGVLLLSFRVVRVGDRIEVGDVRGRVVEMLPIYVVVVTDDHQRVTLPNTLLATGPVRNHSTLPERQARWSLPLTPADDLDAVKAALAAQLRADDRVLPEPAPRLFVQEWDEGKRVLAITAWARTAEQPGVQEEMLEKLGRALEAVRRATK